jgi:4-methylaminobutanoate oxidase (formaldehyde-forming)
VDQFEPVSQTSPRAAGLTAHIPLDDELTRIGLRSIKKLFTFEQDTGQSLVLHRNGAIKITRSRQYELLIQNEIDRGNRFGVNVRAMTADEVGRMVPWLATDAIQSAWYTPDECYLNPPDLPRGYLQSAQDLGARLLSNTEVTGFRVEDGQISWVLTTAGAIETSSVVCAAGAWTRRVAALVGQDIPIVPTRHQLIITDPVDLVAPEHPTIRIVDAGVYMRPDNHGLLLGVYEDDPVQQPPIADRRDFSMAQLPLDLTPLSEKMENIANVVPWLRTVGLRELRGGLPTITPDGHFIAHRIDSPSNFYVLTGCNVMGLYNSPALGELLAEWVCTGVMPADLAPFSLQRFDTDEFGDMRHLREMCQQVYTHRFTLETDTSPCADG